MTVQVTWELRLDLAGKLEMTTPLPGKLAMLMAGGTGQMAAPVPTLQVTSVQLNRATAGSCNTDLGASEGTSLLTVMMYAVVEPAVTALTALVLVIDSNVVAVTETSSRVLEPDV